MIRDSLCTSIEGVDANCNWIAFSVATCNVTTFLPLIHLQSSRSKPKTIQGYEEDLTTERMGKVYLCVVAYMLTFSDLHGFVISGVKSNRRELALQPLANDNLRRELEERSLRKASGKGGGEMAAGAVLGGLLGGPFGKRAK